MTLNSIPSAARLAAIAAIGLVATLLQATSAAAVDPRVEAACAGDYLSYCSQHDPDGPGVRQCMRANGHRLSNRCLNALVAAGEVSKKEMSRRSASTR